jgi:hypothetical protein
LAIAIDFIAVDFIRLPSYNVGSQKAAPKIAGRASKR